MFNNPKVNDLKEILIVSGYQTDFAKAFTNAVKGDLDIKDAGIVIAFSQDKEILEDFKDLLASYFSSIKEANQIVDLAISNAFSAVQGHS